VKVGSRGNGFLVAAAIYALAITALSHVPGQMLARLGLHLWDKAIHAAEFLPLGLLLSLFAFRRFGKRVRPALVLAAVTLLGLALGALDELHQGFVPHRTSSWGDAVADMTGCLLGALLAVAFTRRWLRAGSRV
jgi:VanZ family protein